MLTVISDTCRKALTVFFIFLIIFLVFTFPNRAAETSPIQFDPVFVQYTEYRTPAVKTADGMDF